jgi:hypothetical protein
MEARMGGTPNDGRYTGLIDMINGGGAGAAGQEFQGGGILSDVANALFQPMGYRDRAKQAAQPAAPGLAMPQPSPMAQPMQRPMPRPMQQPMAQPMTGVLPQEYAPAASPAQGAPSFADFYQMLSPDNRAYPPEVLREAYQRWASQYGSGGNGM